MTNDDLERKAIILIESKFCGSKATAKKYGLSDRSIRRYAEQCRNDPELAAIFQQKLKEFSQEWINDLTFTLKTGLSRLQSLFAECDRKDAELIASISGGIRVLGELSITHTTLQEDEA